MKKSVLLLISALVLSLLPGRAQNPNAEKLNAYKIAFFTRRLNLTPQEAEKFWPLYNEFQDKKAGIQKERIKINIKFNQEGATLTDAEMIAMGDKLVELEVLESELSVTFHKQLKAVLSPAKVLRLYQAENQYKLQLLNQLQDRKPGQGLRNNPIREGQPRVLMP